jgi:hypothetical protein
MPGSFNFRVASIPAAYRAQPKVYKRENASDLEELYFTFNEQVSAFQREPGPVPVVFRSCRVQEDSKSNASPDYATFVMRDLEVVSQLPRSRAVHSGALSLCNNIDERITAISLERAPIIPPKSAWVE